MTVIINFRTITPLPNLTPEGYRVTIHRFTGVPVDDFEPAALYKLIYMKAEVRLVEESMIAGDVFIFDVNHLTLAHIAKLANPLIKTALHCAQVTSRSTLFGCFNLFYLRHAKISINKVMCRNIL